MVMEKIKAILAEHFDVDAGTITAETNIEEDLGADSLDVFDMIMTLEDEFSVEIPDEDIENLKNVGTLVNYIESKI